MKRRLLKGVLICAVIISCITTAFAGNEVNTGPVRPGCMDDAYKGLENEVKKGNVSEETLYQELLTGSFSPNIVAKFLDDGFVVQYADALKAAGRLAPDYKVKGSAKLISTQTTQLQTYAPIFNAEYYLKTYPDLANTVGTDPVALLNHFLTVGVNECRQGNAEFNVITYAQKNPDLYAAFGMDARQYYIHYLTCGKAEGRTAN